MEFVFRGKEHYDIFIEPNKDGSVRIIVRSKNLTGESKFVMSAEEFDLLCKIRELLIIKEK